MVYWFVCLSECVCAWPLMWNSVGNHMWNEKQVVLKLNHRKLYWLLGRFSYISMSSNQWNQLWSCTSQNWNIIERSRKKLLRNILDAPWCIRKDNLHKDLVRDKVDKAVKNCAMNNMISIDNLQLLDNDCFSQMIKKKSHQQFQAK